MQGRRFILAVSLAQRMHAFEAQAVLSVMCYVNGSHRSLESCILKKEHNPCKALKRTQDFERKETAKFHKIYESLQDLCTKQFKLEENVAAIESDLRAQFIPMMSMNSMGMGPFPMVMCAPQMMQQMQQMQQMPYNQMNQMTPMTQMGQMGQMGVMPFTGQMGQMGSMVMPMSSFKESDEVQTERTERTESTEAETPTGSAGSTDSMKEVKEVKDVKDVKDVEDGKVSQIDEIGSVK